MASRAYAFGRVEIFERDGNAVQRAAIGAAAQFSLRLPRLFQGEIGSQRDEAMELAIDGIDPIETGVGQFDG